MERNVGPGFSVPLESNGAVPVNIQDQTSKALDLYFIKAAAQTTLTSDITPEDTTIDLTSATGFVDKNAVGIFSSVGQFYFGKQVGAPAGNTITLDAPVDRAFSTGTANAISATEGLNVDGSSVTQVFQIGPIGAGPNQPMVDITKIIGYMESTVAMDDAKFGSLAALTKGIVLRHNNTVIDNIWNAKSNSDLALLCAGDFQYTDKAPAGSYGARFSYSLAGQGNHGVTIRLNPGDTLEVLVQDDIDGLAKFVMMAQGHVVTD